MARMTKDEKLKKFCADLKPTIQLEALKRCPVSLDQADRVPLNVGCAIYGARMFRSFVSHTENSGPQPFKLGNREGRENYRRGG